MAGIQESLKGERQPLLGSEESRLSESRESTNASISDLEKCSEKNEASAVYTRRWYILLIISLMAFTESCAWNTWGPIADTAKEVLGWKDSDIALLTNWGFIMYVISAFFFSWIMDVKGLRVAVSTAGTLLAAGLAIRCIPVKPELWMWTMNVGHALMGLAGPVMLACPPLVSAVWFPAHQRTTATSISTISSYLGVACSFLIGPFIVNQNIRPNEQTSTLSPTANFTSDWEESNSDEHSIQINNIRNLMYIECGWGVFGLVCVLIYFPSKPPLAPSKTSTIKRTGFAEGAKQIIRCGNFWILGIACGTTCGTYAAWMTELTTMLSVKKISQIEAGWLGFYSNIGGAVVGLTLGWSVDRLGGKIRMILLLLSSAAFLCFVWFLLICLKYVSLSKASIYISSILGGLAINSTLPLFYEMGVEVAYPLAEGTTTIVLTWLEHSFGLIFLLLFYIPSIGVKWMIWFMPGVCLASIPLILFFKENYHRLSIDIAEEEVNQPGILNKDGPI